MQNGTLLAEPWATLNVSEKDMAERGLMGIAIDPGFARNGYVYLAYTYRSGTRDVNRLVRMRDADGHGVDETVLIDGAGGGDNHDGGRVKIGPDGKLWWALGEAGGPQNVAQLAERINGKILRLELDGSVPADNPTRGSYVWSMGHRNPQGFAWHPDTGAMYSTEHGPSMNGTSFCCHDEVNLIVAGANYGWPTVWGVAGDARFSDPVLESGPSTTWAPAGATFVTAGAFRGSLVFASLAGQHLHRVVFATDGRTVLLEERLLATTYGRLRDVIEGPDGALYVTTSNKDGRAFPKPDDDKILRVVLR
jgi:glucose/arabinose dehydrogenase